MAVKEIPDIPDNLIAAGIVENLVPPARVQFHAHIRAAPAQAVIHIRHAAPVAADRIAVTGQKQYRAPGGEGIQSFSAVGYTVERDQILHGGQ